MKKARVDGASSRTPGQTAQLKQLEALFNNGRISEQLYQANRQKIFDETH